MHRGKRIVVFTPEAVKQLSWFPVYSQKIIVSGIRKHLIDNDPLQNTKNKFKLHRPSLFADYELRIENWRIFYRIGQKADNSIKIKITVVAEKQGNKLMIEGKDLPL
jgi:mRNA-degrading endonuclease RelE of RelBE toxin-antitoxin system